MAEKTDELRYRCPYCVDRMIDPCEHGRANGLDQEGEPLGQYGNFDRPKASDA